MRNILYGDLSEKTLNFTEKIFNVIKTNLIWVKKQKDLPQMIFFKAVRLYSGFCYIPESNTSALKKTLMEIIINIWRDQKQECMALGRELMRILQEIFRHNVKLSKNINLKTFLNL